MTFKLSWERAESRYHLSSHIIHKMSRLAFPDKSLASYTLLSGGCANLNIKIQLEGQDVPYILRVYLRDKDASYREQKLANLLSYLNLIPKIYTIGDVDEYRFAIAEFMPGISLRDLLLDVNEDGGLIMHEVGKVLAAIAAHQFPQSGFFDKDLTVAVPISGQGYIEFAQECLRHPTVVSQLSLNILSQINFYLKKYEPLFLEQNEKNLVHADFDPANILVHRNHNGWHVSAILDWEFAFSGSFLCDVANMLRYAHQMPPEFQQEFLTGLKEGGIQLPKNWRKQVHILNLISLLDCLKRSNPQTQPNQCADIRELIKYILGELGKR